MTWRIVVQAVWSSRRPGLHVAAYVGVKVSYVWMMLARLSLPNHPPYRKRDAAQHTDGTQNEYDNKRLAYGSVECRQRSTSPVDPCVVRTTDSDRRFPIADDLTITFSKHPNPKIDIWIGEPRKHARQARRSIDPPSYVFFLLPFSS